jgi:CRISPR system Cascade subunit CasD
VSVLLLRLEGPLQAWSAQGRFGVRDTEREPTKSGVLGLVAAALGLARDDDAGLAALADLRMAVRVDRAGTLLRDFHTTGGGRFPGRDHYTVWDTKDCVTSHRYYLQDASFAAALEGEDSAIARIANAVRSPRFPLYLGRRSCPPSEMPLIGVVDGERRHALVNAPLTERHDAGPYRMVVETDGDEGDARYDVPVSFAPADRRYRRRYVVTEWIAAAVSDLEVPA